MLGANCIALAIKQVDVVRTNGNDGYQSFIQTGSGNSSGQNDLSTLDGNFLDFPFIFYWNFYNLRYFAFQTGFLFSIQAAIPSFASSVCISSSR
jgi:hypothetical protein